MSPSILSDLIEGRFVIDQYLGLALLAVALIFGLRQHIRDAKDNHRRNRP